MKQQTFINIQNRTPNKVLHTRLGSCIHEVLALLDLDVLVHLLPVVGHGEDGIRAVDCFPETRLVVQIGGDDLGALAGEFLRAFFGDVAGDGADGPVGIELGVVEEDGRDGAAL